MPNCMEEKESLLLDEAKQKELLKAVESGEDVSPELHDLNVKILKAYFIVMKKIQSHKKLFRFFKYVMFGSKTEKKPKDPKEQKSDTSGEDKPSKGTPDGEKKKRTGGRKKHSEYSGAERRAIKHEVYAPGDSCPCCPHKKLRAIEPGSVLVLKGQALVGAEVLSMERLICDGCSQTYTAKQPNAEIEVKESTAKAAVATAHYGYGLPFYRMQSLQAVFGIPLSDSKLWDMTRDIFPDVLPIFKELLRQAVFAGSYFNDDTPMRVLSHAKKLRTSIILSILNCGNEVALYFTGQKTARDNLGEILSKRPKGLGLPTQMCDASTQSWSADFEVLLCFCLDHCRRNFWYLTIGENPCKKSLHIINLLSEIYKVEALTKDMIDDERLLLHQQKTIPILNEIQDYLQRGTEGKFFEPNSEFGKAAAYFLNHWNELTQFVRHRGAPLSNSPSERGLKPRASYRKNSYFFKNLVTAFTGDVLSSVIETAKRSETNVHHYLTQLQLHRKKVEQNPECWLPWNYLINLPIA
jgi:transposase